MKNQSAFPLLNTYDNNSEFDKKPIYKPVIEEKQVNATLGFFKNFLAKNYHYLISALFILAFFSLFLIVYKVYPFGNNDLSSYDMLAQIVPFIEHLFDVIDGKSSLFYSTSVAGGADLFGTIAYCLVSPFTFIFLFFGKTNVYYGTAIVLPLKLIAVSFSALYFLEKVFPDIPKPIRIIFSLLYAYSGWTFVSNTYINWMDFAIYLPFVAIGYKKILSSGKILYFSIAYALMIYTCFSLACFSMLIVFPILIFHLLLTRKREKEPLVKTCLAFLLAVGLALPIMLPSFMSYLASERSTSLFDNLLKNLDATHIYRKTSYIVSDAFFVFLTLFYFIKNGVKRPIDRFLLIAGVILLCPVFIDECCNLLNGGSYLSYSLRFGFLNSFYCFYVTSKLSSEYFSRDEKHAVPTKNTLIFGGILLLIAGAVIAYLCFYEQIISFIDGIYAKYDEEYDFFQIFAHSLGGLEFLGPFAILLSTLLIVAILFSYKKLCDKKVVAIIISSVLASQLIFYNLCLVKGNLHDTDYYDQYNEIVSTLSTNGDLSSYDRIKDTSDSFTADAPLITHTNSFSVFSSVVDKKNFTATEFFNYKGNGINIGKSTNGFFLGDMILGYKYYLHKYYENGEENYPNLVKSSFLSEIEDLKCENFTVYENLAVFPNAFIVKSGDLNFDGLNYAQRLNKLHYFLGGTEELCVPHPLTENEVTKLKNDTFKISIRITTKESYWFLSTNFPDNYQITYVRSADYDENSAKTLESGADVQFGYYKYQNASYTATIKDKTGNLTVDDIIKYCTPYGVPLKTVYNPDDGDEELYDVVWKNKVDLSITNGNVFNLSTTAEDDNSYLFLNYCNLKGFTATINGKKVSLIDNDLDFIILKLNQGENEITLKYSSPYIKYAVFGLIGGLLVACVVYCLLKFKGIYKTFNGAIYLCGIILFISVFAFFILLPCATFSVKLFKLIV